ncbi:hypothetical protein BZG02_14830 [Labilibaculum filiforme]|uniref:Uncharacterized protein n=1 Tax=Labilibaculum filiforme TaxID=1940526 RepID=A0A2N3HUF1_9BACT|nr:hypothetical protein [Labilibaculum filiforme]PKQ61696.1 hypothetical protein BZG02_14830 [Labilibaculum filiforme]
MTNKIVILSGLLLLFSIKVIASQENKFHPDTIRMQMPNGTSIEGRSTYDGKHDLADNLEIKKLLGDFLTRWTVLNITELEENKSILIKCSTIKEYDKDDQHTITLEEITTTRRISFPVDTAVALMINGHNKLELNSQIAIYFDRIDQLKELTKYDFSQILKNTDQQIRKENDWYFKSSRFVAWVKINKDNSAEMLHRNTILSPATNQIILSGGTSLENVKGEWNGTFYAKMTFQLGNKNLAKQAFSLGYEWMYDFSSGKENINHWVDLGYQRNFSKNPNKGDWYGLNLGYLVKRNGDLFEKASFRLGIEKKINDNISVVPQIYFNDIFKDAFPGIKVKVHF